MRKSRYHPLTMLIDVWGYLRGSIFIVLILFIFNINSDKFIWKYGRYGFIVVTILSFIYFICKWITKKYELTDTAFHLYVGIFTREEQVVPYNRIQNVNQKTTFIHRVFGMTSLYFETAMSGGNATVTFPALTKVEAANIEDFVEKALEKQTVDTVPVFDGEDEVATEVDQVESATTTVKERTTHFVPTAKDTVRATFTSFSFLILIPIVMSAYFKVSEIFSIKEKAEGLTDLIFQSWWLTVIVISIGVIFSMVVGMVRIYLRYGKYEIASDDERVFIKQGVINETSFSIAKKNIQAIKIEQSLIKRIFGMVEVKLISAGQLNLNEDNLEISSLYPFLNKKKAYKILKDMLPMYEVSEEMHGLMPPALIFRLIKNNFFYLLLAIPLLIFKLEFIGVTTFWLYIAVFSLGILINLSTVLNYMYSAYTMSGAHIQYRSGAFGTSFFLSKRNKIMEVIISRSFLQQKFGLATLKIVNRAQPVHYTEISDVPLSAAYNFYSWYKERTEEIELDQESYV